MSITVYYSCELTIKLILHHLLTGIAESIKRLDLDAPLGTICRRDVVHNFLHKSRKWHPLQNRTLGNHIFLLVPELM